MVFNSQMDVISTHDISAFTDLGSEAGLSKQVSPDEVQA
jgi:hypothetical protein